MGWETRAPPSRSTLAHSSFGMSRNEHPSCTSSIKTLPSAKQEQQECEQTQMCLSVPLRKSLSWVLRGSPSSLSFELFQGRGALWMGPTGWGHIFCSRATWATSGCCLINSDTVRNEAKEEEQPPPATPWVQTSPPWAALPRRRGRGGTLTHGKPYV